MRHTTRILLLVPLFVTLGGCGRPRLVYDVDASFRTRSYRTVAPDPRRDRIFIRDGMHPLNPELHLKATMAELAERKYRPVTPEEADLWVSVYVLMGGQAGGGRGGSDRAPHAEGAGEGHRRGGRGGSGMGGPPPSVSGREGGAPSDITAIVILEDRNTGRPIWHGEVTLGPKDKDTEGRPLGIEAAVHQLLQPLPSLP